MSNPFGDKPFPRTALFASAALIGFAILAAGLANHTGIGKEVVVVEGDPITRTMTFNDRADGAVIVATPEGTTIRVLKGDESGFVRGVLRSLSRARAAQGLGAEQPFILKQWPDGLLALDDTATGQRTVLNGFGETNYKAFQRLLVNKEARQ